MRRRSGSVGGLGGRPPRPTRPICSVSDRPSRLFSAQHETVQRSPGWDWIFAFMVAEMRASGCSILSI